MEDSELEALLSDLESDRVERKESLTSKDRICQAICAFANDLPSHLVPGLVFIGARDDGSPVGTDVTDRMLLELASIRDDGNILPFPVMTVQLRRLLGAELAVLEVKPSDATPVRYKGQVWVRIGPRRALATPEEERRLTEKRRARDLPFDTRPLPSAALSDIDSQLFVREYLPSVVTPDVMSENQRTVDEQLASLRFTSPDGVPTAGGPYGQVTVANFGEPGCTDYRNPLLAEAMRALGYVQRFGAGIALARRELERNGSPALEFEVNETHVLAIVRRRK